MKHLQIIDRNLAKKHQLGAGTDIEDITRFTEKVALKKNFLEKIYTEKEIKALKSHKTPNKYLASRFSGKEAVMKAVSNLGHPMPNYTGVEITSTKQGHTQVSLKGKEYKALRVNLSISHTKDKVLAFAVAYKKASREK